MISTVKKLKEDLDDYRVEQTSMKKSFNHNRKFQQQQQSSNFPHGHHHQRHQQHHYVNQRARIFSRINEKLKHAKKKHSDQFGRRLGSLDNNPLNLNDDGVDFKAKLIGIQDVDNARGELMCQKAMQACKDAIKRNGQRKQRIWFNLSASGFKIKDQNSEIVLFNFPVSKISFIAKDITDDRAFGFVYEGIEPGKFKFYAVKTEKLADFVVFDIRNMFQMVYEATKKQREINGYVEKKDPHHNGHLPDKPMHRRSTEHFNITEAVISNASTSVMSNHSNLKDRTKSLADIGAVDHALEESNDLINLNSFAVTETVFHNQNGHIPNSSSILTHDDVDCTKDFLSNHNVFSMNEMENNLPATPVESWPNAAPVIPPRSVALPGPSLALPRPEAKRQSVLPPPPGSVEKLIFPPAVTVAMNKGDLGRTEKTQLPPSKGRDDPFADDFFNC
uniref:PID domain-containing protein n=1 Tax=Romanomermis culicivorax TaxID=13658 RepID=A0A915HYJ4_ROMCU